MAAACDTICGSDLDLARNHCIASEMAQKIKTGIELADLNPRTHIVEEERIYFYKLSFDFHTCAVACTDAHTRKQINMHVWIWTYKKLMEQAQVLTVLTAHSLYLIDWLADGLIECVRYVPSISKVLGTFIIKACWVFVKCPFSINWNNTKWWKFIN